MAHSALALALLAGVAPLFAQTPNDWRGTTDRDWFNDGNWSLGTRPAAGEIVRITNLTANIPLLTNSTPLLGSFTISDGTIVFSNWDTTLFATNVAILNGATVTMHGAFSNNMPSNNIHIACTNFHLAAGGIIDANGKGYHVEQGPGYGSTGGSRGSGGGHGGRGANSSGFAGGITNDTVDAPIVPGSGGGYGHYNGNGSPGGGAILIEADSMLVEGTIAANAPDSGWYGGGGAGGAIYIRCVTFAGTNGLISANGGRGGWAGVCGDGGGGRIAVHYTDLAGSVGVRFQTTEAAAYYWVMPAGMGTVYLPNTNLLSADRMNAFQKTRIIIPGFTSWTMDSLTLTNTIGIGEDTNFALTVLGNLVVSNGGWLAVGGKPLSANICQAGSGIATNPVVSIASNLFIFNGILSVGGGEQNSCGRLDVGGDIFLQQGAKLTVYSGPTNAAYTNGAWCNIAGDVTIASNSWIYPSAHPTNGGSPLLRMRHLNITATNGGINANGLGFKSYGTSVWGPGKGTSAGDRGGGAGYGGGGGRGSNPGASGGPTYGTNIAPVDAGSGGAYGYNGGPGNASGGGAIHIIASNIVNNGIISANGLGSVSTYGGGGSGGGIFITCATFCGASNAIVIANGGNGGGEGGGGGGGRVAIGVGITPEQRDMLITGQPIPGFNLYAVHGPYTGTVSAVKGSGNYSPYAEDGTRTFMTADRVSLTVNSDPANYGTPNPYYGTTIDIPIDSTVTGTVVSPADELNGTRRACLGWILSNSAGIVAQDITTQSVFTLDENLFLTWRWTNEYLLTVNPGAGGTYSAPVGWYTDALYAAGSSASPSGNYSFLEWFGDINSWQATSNPLTILMDQPRTFKPLFIPTIAGVKTWDGVGIWESETNWNPAGLPGPLEETIIRSGTSLMAFTRSTAALVVSNNAALVTSNWTTRIITGALTIRSNGLVTLTSPFRPTDPSNRIHIACNYLTIDVGGRIDVMGRGHYTASGQGKGNGGWSNDGSGAGHGGRGGNNTGFGTTGGAVYDSSNAPTLAGSGGGGGYTATGYQGHGGGAVLIEARNDVVVNGSIIVDGQNGGTYWGGGSGGSILIMCMNFSGTNTGTLSAQGGARGGGYTYLGGGGGGRIAVWNRTDASIRDRIFAGDLTRCSVVESFPAWAGNTNVSGGFGSETGFPGTVVFLVGYPSPGSVVFIK